MRAGETEGTELRKAVNNPLTVVVVVHAGSGTNRGFRVRRIGNGDARSNVRFVHAPERLAPTALTGGREGKLGLIPEPLRGSDSTILEPLVQINIRLHLLSIHFVRNLQ